MPFIPDPQSKGFIPDIESEETKKIKLGLPPELSQTLEKTIPMRALGAAASLGALANRGNQELARFMKEKGGKPGAIAGGTLSTLSHFLIPKTKFEVALLPLGIEGKASRELGPVLTDVAKKSQKAGILAKTVGAGITSTTGIPLRYTAAVSSDPSILSELTPTISEVSKEYTSAFKEAGMKIDSELLKKLTNRRFFPRESEIARLNKLIDDSITKLESGKKLDESEAFVARSAAAAAQRSTMYTSNPTFRSFINGSKDVLDDYLENSSLPNIRDLSRKYFRAVAKEHFQPFFPQTKHLSPNALRSLIMLKQLTDAVGKVATGDIPGAVGSTLRGVAMSPFLIGGAMRTAGALTRRAATPTVRSQLRGASPFILSQIERMRQQNDRQ